MISNRSSLIKKIHDLKLFIKQLVGPRKVNSFYGVYFRKNWLDATFRFYIFGAYGKDYWNHLSNKESEFIFIDIGANQGLYSICAAKNPKCSFVYAFEPVSHTFSLLKKNVAMNGLSSKCNLIKKAISDNNMSCSISLKSKHSGAASLARNNSGKSRKKSEVIHTISGTSLDSIIGNDNHLPIVVKIDVEGFEKTVIESISKSSFFSEVREIFYEVDERWVEVDEIKKTLVNLGFNSFEKIGKGTHYDVLAKKFS